MKKTSIAIAFILAAFNAGAQDMYDGLTFSSNEYYGTARSIGMGNAMTAVGGDLGSIGINPAGSAVYNYSQFTISPGITISSETGSYSAYAVNGSDVFKNPQKTDLTRFSLPNIGATFNFDTGNRSGLKAFTFGFLVNGTNNFTDKMIAGGSNDKNSYLGYLASNALGLDTDYLNGYGCYDESGEFVDFTERNTEYPYYNADRNWYAPWNIVTGAQAGGISIYGTPDPDDDSYYERYIAVTQDMTSKGVLGTLNQAYGRLTTGSKYDVIFNFGLNFNENFYVGANLGITSFSYNYDEYFKEAADDPSDFVLDYDEGNTCFSDCRSRYSYAAEGTGAYLKVGFIALPVAGLRIGGAIQTPTWSTIKEIWQNSCDVNFLDTKFNGSATSPEGNWSYTFRSPYRANIGAAYSFLGMVLVSADYEMTDYSKMKFGTDEPGWDTDYSDVNSDIKDCMGISHSVRVGAEFKPVPELAVRAGYNFTMTPEYSYSQTFKTTLKDKLNALSVGLGYSSKGSFFADLAARMIMYSDESISPYATYSENLGSPLILNKRERYNLVATFGWRF